MTYADRNGGEPKNYRCQYYPGKKEGSEHILIKTIDLFNVKKFIIIMVNLKRYAKMTFQNNNLRIK